MPIRPSPPPGRRAWARPAAAATLVLLLPALSGCYSVRAVQPESLAPRQEVRLHLSPSGEQRVRAVYPIEEAAVTGTVLAAGPDSVQLQLVSAMARSGIESRVLYQSVLVPRSEIRFSEQRRLDPLRTAAVAAVVAAGAVLLAAQASGGGPGSGEGNGGGEPSPQARIPVLRWRLP